MFSKTFCNGPEGLNPQWEAKLSLEASGTGVIDLTGSNPTTVGLPYPADIPALLGRPSVLRYEPTPQGSPDARRAIAAHYASLGREIRPEQLILTASTSEAYSFLFKLLCNPGDEALIPSPTYPLFDTLAGLERVNLIRYPLRLSTRWRADFGFLRSLISTRCKALILVNPNNPTGHLADADEISAYLDLAREYGLALIVDEVFCDYLLGDRPFLPITSDGPLVFTLNGFSKMLGLPQLKLGWIHVAGAPEPVKAALGHLEWIADAFLSVNTPVQAAAEDLLGFRERIQEGIMARIRANLATALELTGTARNARLLKPEAGWHAVLDLAVPQGDETVALDLVRLHGVYVYPGHWFGFEEGCRLVLSLLGPEADFRAGLRRILAYSEAGSDG
ncbi:MAG: pyridoxal phosphate-dependent aminotransferase [Fibrobacterota bacterium]|nr:pyridoxal phosphate-dependent aminotransferase [Fibrobacterota bacterium]